MLIILIIEFELRGPRPPGRICTPKTVYFYYKTKISKEIFRVNYYLRLNIARGNVTYFLIPGPNHLQNLTPKCKILDVFWT